MKLLLVLTRMIIKHPNDADLGAVVRLWYWRRFK